MKFKANNKWYTVVEKRFPFLKAELTTTSAKENYNITKKVQRKEFFQKHFGEAICRGKNCLLILEMKLVSEMEYSLTDIHFKFSGGYLKKWNFITFTVLAVASVFF